VDIPLSFQSFDLGIIGPGDRIYLDYRLSLVTELGTVAFTPNPSDPPILTRGVAEGLFAGFSDPFDLSGAAVLPTISLQPAEPVAEPSSFALAGLAVAFLLGVRVSAKPRMA
jgi:hypothetical protein